MTPQQIRDASKKEYPIGYNYPERAAHMREGFVNGAQWLLSQQGEGKGMEWYNTDKIPQRNKWIVIKKGRLYWCEEITEPWEVWEDRADAFRIDAWAYINQSPSNPEVKDIVNPDAEIGIGDTFLLDGKEYELINGEDAFYFHDGQRYVNHIWNLSSKYPSKELVKANWQKVPYQSPSLRDALEKLYEDYIEFLHKVYNDAHSNAYAHGFRTPQIEVQRGEELRNRIKQAKVLLTTANNT